MFCIAGADGFFGAYLQKLCLQNGERVLALNHNSPVFPDGNKLKNLPFELTQKECIVRVKELLAREENISIIYLIACHSPDFVRKNPQKALEINRDGYEAFLDSIKNLKIDSLFFASSDTVYGENKSPLPFREEDSTSPINIYGEHKVIGERLTLERGFSVARFSYMFAPSLTRKKHFCDDIAARLKEGEEIFMFTDYIRSSLTYPRAAELLYGLIKTAPEKGVYNICSDMPCSKYDIGLYIANSINADTSLVKPCLMDSSGVFSEKRAKTLTMSNEKLKRAIGYSGKIVL